MKKIIIISIVFLSFMGFTSCTQDEIETYKDSDNIYFSPAVDPYVTITGGARVLADSTGFSLGYVNPAITKSIYLLPIRVQGNVSNVDRPVKVTVDPTSTAIEGTHFTLPKNIVIRAGRAVDTIAVTVLRTPDMKTKKVTIVLNLEDNDQFGTKMKTTVVDPVSKKTLSYTRFKLTYDDILSAPKGWFTPYLGTWTSKKFFLMCELIGLAPELFNNNPGTTGLGSAEYSYYQAFMRRYLADQDAAGKTVYEADGVTKMTF